MADTFDVVVLGMGPGGEVAAGLLLRAGKRVALVERELIGGECAYWGCVPSKTLLRGPDAVAEADRAPGVRRPTLDWPVLRDYRDWMIRHLDDAGEVEGYTRRGATVVKGAGQLAGRTADGRLRVQVGGRQLTARHVILATGSEPTRPPVPGLEEGSGVPVWTNREATTLRDIPARAVVLGGGAVAVELGQFLARTGSHVTLVQRGLRLVTREDPRVGELIQAALAADGLDVVLGRQPVRATRTDTGARVELDDASILDADVVVLATGRRPRGHDLGLDTVGVEIDTDGSGGLRVDDRCRLGDGLWAIGDVTGQALFTHVAKYQARVAAENILGRDRRASYDGIPRVIFADPEIAAVGLTTEQASRRGLNVATAEIDLPKAITRPWTYETDPRGTLGLLADRDRKVLLGAWAVAPLAGEWIHQAALAIRAAVPLEVLRDQVAQYPTYTEAYLAALDRLDA